MPRYRIDETAVDTGGGSPDKPLVEWEFAATGVSESAADFSIRAVLRDATTGLEVTNNGEGAVLAPFTLGGTAVLDVDYWFVIDLGGQQKYEAPFVRIPVGKSFVLLNVHINADALAEPVETVILTMVESEAGFLLDGADLGTVLVHTVSIQDASSFSVFFDASASEVTETNVSQTHFLTVNTSIPVPAGAPLVLDLVDLGTGTAVDGVDYEDLPLVGATIASGLSSRQLPVTILGDTAQTGDRTIDIGIANVSHQFSTPLVGTPSAQEVTIREDDATTDDTGTVELVGGDEAVNENGTLYVRLRYDAGPGHNPFSVTFSAQGILPDPAQPGVDYTIEPSPVLFANGEDTRSIRIDGIPDVVIEANKAFQLTLTGVQNPPSGTITIGPNASKRVTVLDQGGPPEFGQDGDLTDYNGVRMALERVPFDATQPHLRVLPPGVGINTGTQEAVEAVFIPAGFTGWTSGTLFPSISGQNFCGTQRAIELGEEIWIHLHGPNGTVDQWATTQSVPVGRELQEVLIEYVVNPGSWDPLRFRDAYVYRTTIGGGNIRILQSGGKIRWGNIQPDNRNIRDIILYTEQGNPLYTTHVCVTHPKWEIGTSGSAGQEGILDNFRWERINIGPPTSSYADSCFAVQGSSGTDTGFANVPQGRLKLYGCQLGMAPRYDVSGAGGTPSEHAFHDGPQRVVRSDPACWDVRHSDPTLGGAMPWPPFWPGSEHAFYIGPMVGTATYPDLDYNWHPQGPVPPNTFLNLYPAERHAPTHYAATPSGPGGAYEGPPFSATNTFFQLVQRPNYNSRADGAGSAFIARCVARGVAGTRGGGGIGFAIYGNSGTIYWKDCGVAEHFFTGIGSGGIQYLEDGTGNNSSGPQGRFRQETPAGSGRRYTSEATVIDGFTLIGSNGGKTPMRLNGVRSVLLRRFDLRLYEGGQVQIEWNGVNQACGNAFCEEFITTDLVDPDTGVVYDGPFSAYPGWRPFGTKIQDEYHSNWYRTGANEKTLTDQDIDNLPTAGPPSYDQVNGVLAQQYANRMTATGDGLGTVDASVGSPPWGSSAYLGGTVRPAVPNVQWDAAERFLGEAVGSSGYTRFRATMFNPIGSPLRVYYDLSFGAGISAITFEYANQGAWMGKDTIATWQNAIGISPRVLLPVDGRDGALSTSPQSAPDFAEDDVWQGTYNDAAFRVRADQGGALTTGTKTVTARLQAPFGAGLQPDYEYPLGSGTYVDTGHSGPQDVFLRVVPAVDFSTLEWGQGQVNFPLTGASEGDTLTVQCLRLGGVNSDSQLLTTTVPLIATQIGGGLAVADFTTLVYGASQFLITVTITITDLPNWSVGDSATLTLDLPNAENGVDGGVPSYTINFTLN